MTRAELAERIQEIEDRNYYNRKQFTIDLFENITETYVNTEPKDLDVDEETFLGALSYALANVLEIMHTDITDYQDVKDLNEAVQTRISTLEAERRLKHGVPSNDEKLMI